MNKQELVRAVSQECGRVLPQDKILQVLNAAVEVIERTLDSGEAVKWQGFGSLIVKEVQPRRIYSPKKKDCILTKGTKSIVFRESRNKKDS
jgi:nucleoid DNA-binding protein